MNITEKLNSIRETKEALKTCLRDNNVEVADTDPFYTYPDKFRSIEAGGGGADLSEYFNETITYGSSTASGFDKVVKKAPALINTGTNCDYMFSNEGGLTNIDLSKFNTSNVTTMQNMFSGCYGLTSLDLSSFNTSNVTTMYYMFSNCSRLTSINLSNFNTSNVTNMDSMFNSCRSLQNIDVSNFNTSNVTTMKQMFYDCSALTSLDVSNFNTSNVTSMHNMFYRCSGLTSLDLSNFDASKLIIVSGIISNCDNLTNLNFMTNLGKGYTQKTNNYSNYTLTLSYCKSLTYESLMDVINKLYDLNLTYDVANGGTLYTQKLVLGATNKAKLEATEEGLQAIANATAKGWVVS